MTVRDRKVFVIVGALVALIACWLFVVGPKRSEASKLQSEITTAQSQLNSARSQVAQAQVARKSFSVDYSELVRLGEAVPPDDNVPSLLVQLQHAASLAHVDFRTLNLVPGSAAAPAPTPAPAASPSIVSSGSPTPASTSTSTSTASSTASVPPSAAALPPGAAVGPAGFPTEQFTLTFEGNFFHLSNFFQRLEAFVRLTNKQVVVSGRLMTLNAISLGAGPAGFPQMDASVSATTYLVPAAEGLLNGATAGGPAAAASGTTISGSTSGSASGATGSSAPPTAAVLTPSAP